MEFEELVHTYQEPLYWHIRRLVVNHEDARDLLQECFLQAWRAYPKLRDHSALRAWLYKIATNLCFSHHRRHRIQPLSTEELSQVLLERLEASSYVDYEQGEALRFQRALMTLSEQQRTVFNLRYWEEMPYDEIAQVLGTTSASLRVSYHHAVERIKAYLENND